MVELRSAVMGVLALSNWVAHGELIGVGVLIVIGVARIVLAPAKQHVEQASAVVL